MEGGWCCWFLCCSSSIAEDETLPPAREHHDAAHDAAHSPMYEMSAAHVTQSLLGAGASSSDEMRWGGRASRRVHPEDAPLEARREAAVAEACVAFTHEGGEGGRGKENQDASFAAQPRGGVFVCGVLDGHGKKHGRLAAQVAAQTLCAHLCAEAEAVHARPQDVLAEAFHAAHTAVFQAILRTGERDRTTRAFDPSDGRGAIVLEWLAVDDDEPDGEHAWEAADGGTTATVAVLLSDGKARRLIVAATGDSSGFAFFSSGERMRLLPDHSPSSAAEFARLCHAARARGGAPPAVHYDCEGEVAVFRTNAEGAPEVDAEAMKQADAAMVGVKNSAGERCTVLIIPEETFVLPAMADAPAPRNAEESVTIDEQHLCMTRSIGDFFAQRHGVICTPQCAEFLLAPQPHGAEAIVALMTDGVWDLMSGEEVGAALWEGAEGAEERLKRAGGEVVRHAAASDRLAQRGAAVGEAARARGAEWFEEYADNLTGVLLELRSCTLTPVGSASAPSTAFDSLYPLQPPAWEAAEPSDDLGV